MAVKDVLRETETKMKKTIESVSRELSSIRTSRASTSLVDNIKVEYYGTQTPLGQMAQISVPEARMIVIKPFDASQIQEVVKAIQASDLGVNPQVEGKIIRINLPPLSEERRKKLVALVKERAEAAKVSVRNVRRDSNRNAEQSQKDGELTEDDLRGLKDEIQEQTKEHESKIDEILGQKIDELMAV